MATMDLDYVKPVKSKGKTYYYFQYGVDGNGNGGTRTRLRGAPMSRDFLDHYYELLPLAAPNEPKRFALVRGASGPDAPVGSVGWAILQFTDPAKNPKWQPEKLCYEPDGKTRRKGVLSEESKRSYRRHFEWWRTEYGVMMLRDFRENILRDIRNEFISVPTSGNAKLDLFNLLWNFVKEFCSSAINLPAVNPATLVPRLETLNDPHKVWPENVIKTFVANPNRLTTLYYLARFTGQRLGDCCKMQRSDFNDEGNQIHVVQEKTGTKIWVPIHRILADHMRSLPTIKGKNNDYLTVNTRGDPWIASTVTEALQLMMQDLVLPAGYTMHGLRHLAGVELAYAGCGENEIAAILGHKDTRQTRRYVEQAQQIKLAESAMAKREAYDEKQEASAAKKKKAA